MKGRVFTIPIPADSKMYCSARRLECVVDNGSMFSDLVPTSFFESSDEAHQDLQSEVRSLRRALNLPVESLLQSKDHVLNKHADARMFASQAYSCDSGYSSRSDQQSVGSANGPSNMIGPTNGRSNVIGPTYDFSPAEMKTNSSSMNDEDNLWVGHFGSQSFFEKSLKSSLEESETKRMLLLEKLKEAHSAIKNQAEKLAATESEICYLRGQLKSTGLEQEGLQQEVESLVMEKRTFEVFRLESIKKREEFLSRIKDLDEAFKVLATSHNSLQADVQKKEIILKQTTSQLNTVEQEKNTLLEEYQKVVREQAVMKRQLTESLKVNQEARQKQESMNQEIVQLKMERDIQHGKVTVLQEEILQHQQSYSHLVREQEVVLKEKAEQQRRLQREIQEKMSLKMVYGLLEEESANVKEAFEKLEQFTNVVERKSKELSKELDRYKQQFPSSSLRQEGARELSDGKIARIEMENVELRKESEKLSSHQVQMEAEQKKLLETNEKLSLQMAKMKEKEKKAHAQQQEVETLKENITRLESEKAQLMSELSKLHEDKKRWILRRSELQMSQAELNAENNQLRSELNKESFDDVCLELKNVKSELSKVWDMLELKEKQFEGQTQELEQERQQSQRWAEEVTRLRKSCAELAAKTSSRGQMVATLRDELTRKCDEITNQKCSAVQTSNERRVGAEMKRRRSDGDIYMSETKACDHSMTASDNNAGEMTKMAERNSQLNQRIQELLAERDSALQDAQDLVSGMQQLREAFEEEMERQLERERSTFEREKQFLQAQQIRKREDDQQWFGIKSKLQKDITKLSEENTALEIKSKNLEFERDELRNQVEELCRMRTAAEEKGVQVDSALSPRKRESKALYTRKRSSSVGMMPPAMAIKEVPDSQS